MEIQKGNIKNFIRDQIYRYRKSLSYSQEYMAELLHISPRSYFDQEHEKYGFSTYTCLRFLLLLSKSERTQFFQELQELFETCEQREEKS